MNDLFIATAVLETLDISFDKFGNTTISHDKLLSIISEIKLGNLFCEYNSLPNECYVIIDRSLNDFYAFPLEELNEWEKDGSSEHGDALYRIELVKTY